MKVIISPAKTQDFEKPTTTKKFTQPTLLKQTKVLMKELEKLSKKDIVKLMSVSDKIAELNYERFHDYKFPFNLKNAKQALFAFQGDVYRDIDIENYNDKAMTFAQDHLRILSGLYGLLRPLDLIQPYRLEMKTKLKNPAGKDLYEFWGQQITAALQDDTVINLASNEYSKALKNFSGRMITPVFKEIKDGQPKIIAIYAKLARGTMSNFIIKTQITKPEKIQEFNQDGYKFQPKLSNEDEFVFHRKSR